MNEEVLTSERPVDEVPVLIVGAGPVGLILSMLLSRQGIRHVVLEKRERVSTLPRARGINVRSVEILTQLDVGEDLRNGSLPPLWTRCFVYTEKMAGELVGTMPGNMGPGMAAAFSPYEYRVAAQDRLDPMLYAKASTFPEATILFNQEVMDYADDGSSVVATVRSNSPLNDGAERKVRAKYIVAADGGKSGLRERAGIAQSYSETYRSFLAAHFRGDLSRYTNGREGALIWTLAPGVEGVFHPLDGDQSWVAQIQYDPSIENPNEWPAERVIGKIRAMIGLPEDESLDIELHKYYTYTLTVSVCDRFREGRLLLAGDAAHRTLPHGGWGLNTGIHSAHNLAWKLGAVLRGDASEALLDTYSTERREAALRNCEFAKVNSGYIEQMMRALRDASGLKERRALVMASKQYGNWTGLDLGIHYEGSEGSCAFVPDRIAPPSVADPVVDYEPHAKPGWRAPHLWVRAAPESYRISTIMLFDQDFVLLTGPNGQAWVDAARELSWEMHPQIKSFRVARDGDLVPESVDFCKLYGITPSGAVLVRPDGHVAYRAPILTNTPMQSLRGALDQSLQRAPTH